MFNVLRRKDSKTTGATLLRAITETSEKAEVLSPSSLASSHQANSPQLAPPKASLSSLFASPSVPTLPKVSLVPGLPKTSSSAFSDLSFSYVPKSTSEPNASLGTGEISKLARISGFVNKWTDKLREENKAIEKIRKRISGKIEFKPPSNDYYDKLPLKPGLLFLLAIATHCNQTPLHINIPDILVIYKVILWLRTEQGRVKSRKEFELKDFLKVIDCPGAPYEAVMRNTNDHGYGSRVVCLSKSEATEKFNKLQFPQFGSIQKFVPTAGGHIVTTRLFYRTRGSASKAYSIKLPADSSRYALSTEFGMARLEVTEVSGHIVSSLCEITARLIAFLTSHYHIRFETLVLDFIRDVQGVFWLINCKGFLYDVNVNQARLTRHASLQKLQGEERKQVMKEKQDEQLNSKHCRLCLLPYQPSELCKIMPYKLLLQYKHHALKNGRTRMDLSHIRATAVDSISHTLRVCEICYMLVMNEFQLEKQEERMATLLGIPVREMDFARELEVVQPISIPSELQEWRVLIHFEDITLYEGLKMDPSWWIHYDFLGLRYSSKLSDIVASTDTCKFSLPINRLHYFFAVKDAAIVSICHNLSMNISLTYSGKSTPLLEGTFAPLSFFSFDFSICSAFLASHTVLLFANEGTQAEIRLKIGFSLERKISPKSLPVSIRRLSQVYIPEETYITSEPLPQAWLEIFTSAVSSQRTDILSSRRELEQMYDPVLRIEEELETLNKFHPAKTTAVLQKIRVNRLSIAVQRESGVQKPRMSASFIRPVTPMNISSISHWEPEETDSDLRMNESAVQLEMSHSVTSFLCHRSSSAKTLRLLRQASTLPRVPSTLPDQTSTEAPSHSMLIVDIGNESVEMLRRPKAKVIQRVKTGDKRGDRSKDWRRVYGRRATEM